MGGLKNTTIGALSHAMNAVKVQQHNQHDESQVFNNSASLTLKSLAQV
jgi:hypothetical protein